MNIGEFLLAAEENYKANIKKLLADFDANPENYENMDEHSWFESLRSFEEC